MTDWTPAPLSSPAEDLRAAMAALEQDDRRGYEPDPWLAGLVDRWLERRARALELYRRHHPLPLPIDGHAYRRRRRRR